MTALRMPRSKHTRRWLTLSGLVVLLGAACACAGQVALHNSQASLTRFELAGASAPCVGKNSSLYNMPTVGVTTEWRIAATPLQVMNRFMQHGWGLISRMSSNNLRLVPFGSTEAQIGVLQVRVITVASIRYAEDKLSTRLFLPVSFVFCLREL